MVSQVSRLHILAGVLGVLFGVFAFMHTTSAQSVDELRQSIAEKTSQIQDIEKEIERYKNDLGKIATLKANLSNLIASLETTQKKLDTEIRLTATKVDNTDLKIRQLDTDITYKENEIENLRAALRQSMRIMYEYDEKTLAEIALSGESFSGIWGDLAAMAEVNDSLTNNVIRVKNAREELLMKQGEHREEKGQLIDLKSELSDRMKIAEDNKKEQTAILAQTRNQESAYTKLLNEQLALKEAFEREIRDYETTLKFILDPSSIPPRGTKVFSWPLDKVTITQRFGRTSDSGRLYASGTHNGVDFGTPVGTAVKSVLAGTVVGTGDTDLVCPRASYGKWVLVRHNNGLSTLYAHLSLIRVSAGDTVQTGEVIAYSGNTGYSTGPHLHLTTFATSAVSIESRPSVACGGKTYTMPVAAVNGYLDPLDYL